MAKTSTTTTLGVGQLVVGQPVTLEEARAVIEQLNWSHGERVCELLLADDQPDTFGSSSGWQTSREHELWIDPDAATVEVLALCTVPATNTVEVRTTIGGATLTQTIAAAASGVPQVGTLATSSTGTGWQLVRLELNHTIGGATTATRDLWQLQIARMDATAMPDPEL